MQFPDIMDRDTMQSKQECKENFSSQAEQSNVLKKEKKVVTQKTRQEPIGDTNSNPYYEAIRTNNERKCNELIERYGKGILDEALEYSTLQSNAPCSKKIVSEKQRFEAQEKYKKALEEKENKGWFSPTMKIAYGALAVGTAGIYLGFRFGKWWYQQAFVGE